MAKQTLGGTYTQDKKIVYLCKVEATALRRWPLLVVLVLITPSIYSSSNAPVYN